MTSCLFATTLSATGVGAASGAPPSNVGRIRQQLHLGELRKVPKLIGIANGPDVYNVLLHNSHRDHYEGMAIHADYNGWLPIRFRDLQSVHLLSMELGNSDQKPCDLLWSMQGTCSCSSYLASAVGRQPDIRGQKLG
jgi:hypothetical protein